MARILVSLLGYDLDSNVGDGLSAVVDQALNDLVEQGRFPASLAEFTEFFLNLDDTEKEYYSRYLKMSALEQAGKRLARLDVGVRKLLFHQGLPISIDLLLGHGTANNVATQKGKTRLSVIYLNTLHDAEDKTFLIATLAEQLYRWMLSHPSNQAQALFYIDEVAPFIPPISKPACKDSLMLLFKQARKYGVCCLMATQNPGDVDYKALAQFGTWAIGRLTTQQDIKRIEPTLKSLDPMHVDALKMALPSLAPGQFLLLSPDNFAATQPLQTRWLLTQHRTLNEDDIEQLTDACCRARFAELEKNLPMTAVPTPVETDAKTVTTAEETSSKIVVEEKAAENIDNAKNKPLPTNTDLNETDGISTEQRNHLQQLARSCSMTTREYAEVTGYSDSKARQILKSLVDAQLANHFRAGRSQRYWALDNGLRPDLGLCKKVKTLVANITASQAEEIGHAQRGRKLFGFIGGDELLARVQLNYRVVMRLKFREKIEKALWQRLFGSQYEERIDNVYFEPQRLQLLSYTPNAGIQTIEQLADYASHIQDFDNGAQFIDKLPAELSFDETEWHNRPDDEKVKQRFKARFYATVQRIEPIFVPVWQLHLRMENRAGERVVTIDGLAGKLMEW